MIGTGFRGDGSIEPTNVFIASTATIEACCQKHRDKIKANGGIVSCKGDIHEAGGKRTNRCGSATRCCGSTISLEVGGDSGTWWRAVGAFVNHKTSQETDQNCLRVEGSSSDPVPPRDEEESDLVPPRDEEESSMDVDAEFEDANQAEAAGD